MKMSILLVSIALFVAGCSSTWEGMKQDSSKVWKDTKEAVHEATE
ncbi:entericidin EcnAB [Vibrio ostreicida]|uniref:Entericidin EcnAB n=1 Tax=Vibrio ostreicida TaxID=526588 RepID=A0ABT8C219_9VIBR|nr:entericidin EcnAB [Vibrio ostreicida]MDN3612383.1 entericidin EcnAB [Vibrio ostreicida]NPD09846.1 entericidin EcnAB [Vibrio ostreicida]